MAEQSKEPMTVEQLRAKIGAIKKVQAAIMVIFAIIILAWIVLGYWKDSLPVFISTVVMAAATSVMFMATRNTLVAELKARESTGTTEKVTE